MKSRIAILFATAALAGAARAQVPAGEVADPNQWLEDQYGAKSMAWVAAENAKTTAVLEKDAHFAKLYDDALDVVQAKGRIPYPRFMGGMVYNFWQDSAHVRGLWRRTTLASYRTAEPRWTTVLDLDSLARAEHANWVWKGATCAEPAERRCMLHLSDGGEDAVTVREFDVTARAFVPDGFVLSRGKQRVDWMGEDTLLVSREWNPGELTASGYPFIVKRWVRGQPLDQATEVFRGSAQDGGYGVTPYAVHDGSGHRIVLVSRPLTTFDAETYVVRGGGVARLDVPMRANAVGMVDGQLLFQLSQAWDEGTVHVPTGSLVAVNAARATADPSHVVPVTVFTPGPRESVGATGTTRDHLVASIYDNVRGRVYRFTPRKDGSWTRERLSFPDNLATDVLDADIHGTTAFVTVAGFLTPTSLWQVNVPRGTKALAKSMPAQFDASRDTVEQLEATSTDGTRIPYFVVHPKGMALDGHNPTILTAYGGFEVSMLPHYSGVIGKLWLERGGVFVLANIRGGGEFGPAWHEAGLKTHRQIIYDDFASVGRDLVARHITSARRLGIMGGSNGGLLMGVELTQHPELWNAVDIQVPLLDMLRYERIDAGSSWVGEYGSVSNPDERAFWEKTSPYQNLRAGVQYPEPFIWTTTKDDRVGPQHARKFAAKMATLGDPYLFYEVTEGGHGAGANLRESAHTNALEYTYFVRRLME